MSLDSSIDRLVARPRPKPGESCTGYLVRVTEANVLPSLSYVLKGTVGNTGGFIKPGKEHETDRQWKDLEQRLELPVGEFRRKWPRQVTTAQHSAPAVLGSLRFTKADHLPGITHLCPDCVADDGFCHALWEVRYYTVCHRHKRLMVSHCGSCGAHVSASRPNLSKCG